MSIIRWMAAPLLVMSSALAFGQEKVDNSADASKTESTVIYESAFGNYVSMTEEAETPDKAWRSANDEMGKLGGHAGHIKGQPPTNSGKSSTSGIKATDEKESKAADHSGHGMGHQGKGK